MYRRHHSVRFRLRHFHFLAFQDSDPPRLQFMQASSVAELKYSHRQLLPVGGARRNAYAKALGVKGRAYLHEVAVDDGVVFVDGSVPEEGVVLLLDLHKTHTRVVHHGVRLDLGHLGPHLGKMLDFGVLQS